MDACSKIIGFIIGQLTFQRILIGRPMLSSTRTKLMTKFASHQIIFRNKEFNLSIAWLRNMARWRTSTAKEGLSTARWTQSTTKLAQWYLDIWRDFQWNENILAFKHVSRFVRSTRWSVLWHLNIRHSKTENAWLFWNETFFVVLFTPEGGGIFHIYKYISPQKSSTFSGGGIFYKGVFVAGCFYFASFSLMREFFIDRQRMRKWLTGIHRDYKALVAFWIFIRAVHW